MPRILGIAATWCLCSNDGRGQQSWIEELSALKSSLEDKGIHPALVYDGEGILSGKEGDDALPYQEKQVRNAIREVMK